MIESKRVNIIIFISMAFCPDYCCSISIIADNTIDTGAYKSEPAYAAKVFW